MNSIFLYLDKSGWMARFAGPHAGYVLDVMGADVIPTGFTATAEPELVLGEIRRLNPGATVIVEGKCSA